MKITKKHILSFCFVSLLMLSFGFVVLAHQASAATSLWDSQIGLGGEKQGVIGKTGFSEVMTEPDDIRVVIGEIIKIILTFLGIIFTIIMLVAGFKWMNSQGDESVIADAKGSISASIIGLVIIMSSYAITQMVLNYLYAATP